MILNPPGFGAAQRLPHWPFLEAVDDALTRRGIPPGTVRADYRYPRFGDRLFIRRGDRLGSLHGLSLRPGASRPLTVLHRVYAASQDVAAVAEQFVGHGRLPAGEYGAEWDEASYVGVTIDRFRATLQDPDGLWTGSD